MSGGRGACRRRLQAGPRPHLPPTGGQQDTPSPRCNHNTSPDTTNHPLRVEITPPRATDETENRASREVGLEGGIKKGGAVLAEGTPRWRTCLSPEGLQRGVGSEVPGAPDPHPPGTQALL